MGDPCFLFVSANKNVKHAALWELLGVAFPPSIGDTVTTQPLIMNAIDELAMAYRDTQLKLIRNDS